MNLYLIEFKYQHYCQGYEDSWTFVLVAADSFEAACKEIEHHYKDAESFTNKTIGGEIQIF